MLTKDGRTLMSMSGREAECVQALTEPGNEYSVSDDVMGAVEKRALDALMKRRD